jgi:hypothetical protein
VLVHVGLFVGVAGGQAFVGHFIEDENAPLPDEAADKSFRGEALTNASSR